MACLRAAKGSGALIRKLGGHLLCPGSGSDNVGWYGRSSWSDYAADISLGGPWSVEFVAELCERGLFGVKHDEPHVAKLTKVGRLLLRPVKAKATSANPGTARELKPDPSPNREADR